MTLADFGYHVYALWSLPDLPFCLGVLKHRASLFRGSLIFLPKKMFAMDFCLCGAILKLTAFCSIWTLIEECSSIIK
jgi:hypothetical protein